MIFEGDFEKSSLQHQGLANKFWERQHFGGTMLKVYDFLWFRAIRVFRRRTWKKLEFPHTLETYQSPPSLPIAVSCCCLYSKLTRNSHFVTDALESTTSTIPFNQGTSGKSQAESCLAEINLEDTVWLSLVGCVLQLKGVRMSLISLVGMGNQRSCLCTTEKDVFGTSILVWVPITHQQTSEAYKSMCHRKLVAKKSCPGHAWSNFPKNRTHEENSPHTKSHHKLPASQSPQHAFGGVQKFIRFQQRALGGLTLHSQLHH